jgi:hypothetical protein
MKKQSTEIAVLGMLSTLKEPQISVLPLRVLQRQKPEEATNVIVGVPTRPR